MVADEEKRHNRFQQGLRVDIQMLLIPHQLKTYSQVLSIARDVEQGLEKKRRVELQYKPMKRANSSRCTEEIQSDLLVPQ